VETFFYRVQSARSRGEIFMGAYTCSHMRSFYVWPRRLTLNFAAPFLAPHALCERKRARCRPPQVAPRTSGLACVPIIPDTWVSLMLRGMRNPNDLAILDDEAERNFSSGVRLILEISIRRSYRTLAIVSEFRKWRDSQTDSRISSRMKATLAHRSRRGKRPVDAEERGPSIPPTRVAFTESREARSPARRKICSLM